MVLASVLKHRLNFIPPSSPMLLSHFSWLLVAAFMLLLSGCDHSNSTEQVSLPIPAREGATFVTDQAYVAGNSLLLWKTEEGGCQLQAKRDKDKSAGTKQSLQPQAPCYFIKSPGSEQVQVFRQSKTTRIVAVLGTPLQQETTESGQRCGKEVQGLIVNRHGQVRPSERMLAGSAYCADSGLDNFQYSLFHGS